MKLSIIVICSVLFGVVIILSIVKEKAICNQDWHMMFICLSLGGELDKTMDFVV